MVMFRDVLHACDVRKLTKHNVQYDIDAFYFTSLYRILQMKLQYEFTNVVTICSIIIITISPNTNKDRGDFKVPSGTLGFSVFVYTVLSLLCILILMVRRTSHKFGYAELGGPEGSKRMSALLMILLWFTYITLSALQAYGIIDPKF